MASNNYLVSNRTRSSFSAGLIVLLFFLANISQAQEDTAVFGDSIIWLKENVIPINHIDSGVEDFSDLDQIKTILADKRIVVLGEPSHGDGAVFEAKSRLIKFLHQEMNFDVLVFESGFYDLHKSIRSNMNSEEVLEAAENNIFRVWTKSSEAWPVFEYAAETYHTPTPLELSGMDIQFSTPDSVFMADFLAYLSRNKLLNLGEKQEFATTLQNLLHDHLFTPDSIIQEHFLSELDDLEAKMGDYKSIQMNPQDKNAEFWGQIIKNIRSLALTPWNQDLGFRERQMADNLKWLAERKYPNRKIIVWVASVYSFRNREGIDTMQPGFSYHGVSMGDVLFKTFGRQLYNLAFTAYKGEYGAFYWDNPTHKINAPSKNSLEYFLGATNYSYAWVNLSSIKKSQFWFDKKPISRPLGYIEMRANWPDICDGIFFIRKMYPSTERL